MISSSLTATPPATATLTASHALQAVLPLPASVPVYCTVDQQNEILFNEIWLNSLNNFYELFIVILVLLRKLFLILVF